MACRRQWKWGAENRPLPACLCSHHTLDQRSRLLTCGSMYENSFRLFLGNMLLKISEQLDIGWYSFSSCSLPPGCMHANVSGKKWRW